VAERIAGSQWARRAIVRTLASGANSKNEGPECLNVDVVVFYGAISSFGLILLLNACFIPVRLQGGLLAQRPK
jgi:hypothetical protein